MRVARRYSTLNLKFATFIIRNNAVNIFYTIKSIKRKYENKKI